VVLARRVIQDAKSDEDDQDIEYFRGEYLRELKAPRQWINHLPKVFCSRRFNRYKTSNIRLTLGMETAAATK
jgi:hypothetical protein